MFNHLIWLCPELPHDFMGERKGWTGKGIQLCRKWKLAEQIGVVHIHYTGNILMGVYQSLKVVVPPQLKKWVVTP